jgi:type I restriction enzyme R subunit
MSTPESRARALIDQRLGQAGWLVQERAQLNLSAATGVAVREYPTDSGPADYVLFVDCLPVGVIEAKRAEEGERLTSHEPQTLRYANASLKWRRAGSHGNWLGQESFCKFTQWL